jgi:MFS family permease
MEHPESAIQCRNSDFLAKCEPPKLSAQRQRQRQREGPQLTESSFGAGTISSTNAPDGSQLSARVTEPFLSRWRVVLFAVGALLVVLGIAWVFLGPSIVHQVIFAENNHPGWEGENGPLLPDEVKDLARSTADLTTGTDWRLLLPIFLLVGAGAALIAAVSTLPRQWEARRSWRAQLYAASVGAIVLGSALVLIGVAAPDANGWFHLFGGYSDDIWVPVLVVGVLLLVGGIVARAKVSFTPTPHERAERAAALDEMRRSQGIEVQAEQIKQYEQAYTVAHNGELPPASATPILIQSPGPSRTNTMSILALIFGFLGSLLGIVFGHIALSQIKRTGEGGRGFAVAGLIVGYIQIGAAVVFLIVFAVLLATQG